MFMSSGSSDRDALSKLLQMGTVAEYQSEFEILINRLTGISEYLLKSFYISGLKPALQYLLSRSNPTTLGEAFSLARAAEARFTNLQLLKLLRSNPTTLGEAFFRALIIDARFENKNNQAVDNNVDEEGKNVKDQQVSEGDDGTNNDDISYMRQPIEDEAWFLAHETDYPNVNEKKADHGNNESTQENRVLKGRDVSDDKSRKVLSVTPWVAEGGRRVLCYVQGSRRRKRKKSVGCSSGRWDYTLFGASVFPLFNPGPGSFAHQRIWDPEIKIFLDDTLRAKWFRMSGECYALSLG
ncbi:hypothetical protein Tco_1017259 [Tanacetum coccineum]|uniref:Retrotransposon gag domain-containing protein n=1 Tax=Tanacetum coccineum TaxID=301880 RepID=A0ABQ5FS18_9ASTR